MKVFKRIKWSYVVLSAMFLLLGIYLVVNPETSLVMICRILGLTLGVEAAFMIPPLAIALARHEHSAAVGFAVTVAAILVFAALLRRIKATGTPLIVVCIAGRPLDLSRASEQADALLMAWYPGARGGDAVAETILGRNNPAGRLPITIPRAEGQIPVYYNKKRPANHDYTDLTAAPLYPFGYGLSYTRFEYSDLTLSSDSFPGRIDVSVKISNTGKVAGKEVVQLYLTAPAVLQDKPERELKGFAKTRLLAPGESQILTFTLDPRSLCSFRSGISSWVAEAGSYEVKIGASSQDIRQRASFSLGKELVVEKLHDVLAPNVPIKDMGTTSAKVLGTDQPFDHYHELDYKFNWHW